MCISKCYIHPVRVNNSYNPHSTYFHEPRDVPLIWCSLVCRRRPRRQIAGCLLARRLGVRCLLTSRLRRDPHERNPYERALPSVANLSNATNADPASFRPLQPLPDPEPESRGRLERAPAVDAGQRPEKPLAPVCSAPGREDDVHRGDASARGPRREERGDPARPQPGHRLERKGQGEELGEDEDHAEEDEGAAEGGPGREAVGDATDEEPADDRRAEVAHELAGAGGPFGPRVPRRRLSRLHGFRLPSSSFLWRAGQGMFYGTGERKDRSEVEFEVRGHAMAWGSFGVVGEEPLFPRLISPRWCWWRKREPAHVGGVPWRLLCLSGGPSAYNQRGRRNAHPLNLTSVCCPRNRRQSVWLFPPLLPTEAGQQLRGSPLGQGGLSRLAAWLPRRRVPRSGSDCPRMCSQSHRGSHLLISETGFVVLVSHQTARQN
ncbi:hypothetical protein LZ30DRAFT_83451 [Colletotrichum cereale]|nr:hypothetical protein LZ30DRAFT_83451 [Colletotrichum cereale]